MDRIIDRRLMRAVIAVLMAMILYAMVVQPSFAATVRTIPSTANIVQSSGKLKLTTDNYRATWGNVNHKVKTGPSGETVFCIPIKNTSASWTVKDFLTLDFTNVGTIGGRQLDCRVKLTSMTVSARKGSSNLESSDGYMGVCCIWLNNTGLQFGTTTDRGSGYKAAKTITHTVTLTYHDTGEVVDLPFFQAVRDLDTYATYNQEGWESLSGYIGTYYKYSTNYNVFSGNKVSAPVNAAATDGNNTILVSGIYAPTTGGNFSARFYEGDCGTILNLYSQYSADPKMMSTPVKSANKERMRPGDRLTYTVEQVMGTFYKDTMTTYGRLVFTDVIPEHLTYMDAKVTDGSGADITDQGELTYDEQTRTLCFTMGDAWRTNVANYNGQKLTLTIKTRAGNIGDVPDVTVENMADVSFEPSVMYPTNKVETLIYQDVKLQIVKRLETAQDNIVTEHGYPTFLFAIAEKGGDVWYKQVRFTEEAMQKMCAGETYTDDEGWSFQVQGGTMIAESPIWTMPYGKYDATEIGTSRYQTKGRSVENESLTSRFTFTNIKDNWQYYSHNDLVINRLEGGEIL